MKKDLLILHGALGAISQFEALKAELSTHYTVHGLTFSGHGGKPAHHAFGIEQFAGELNDFIEEFGLHEAPIFGYSMGGYVALYAASQGLRTKGIVTLGTKMHWTPEGAAKEIAQLQPALIEEKVPAFAAQQAALHAPLDWKAVMQATASMMRDLGNTPLLTGESLASVTCPVYCLRGDQDRMVSAEETRWAVAHLSKASYTELPDTPHPIEKVQAVNLARVIRSYLQ